MSFELRRALFLAALVACMVGAGWAGTYQAWRWVAGEDVGTSLAVFWDLQVESYANVALLALVVDLVYGLRREPRGWVLVPRRAALRAIAVIGLIGLALACAAEGPLRSVLQVPLPDDIGASVAHYFRRALEGVLATIGVMVFLEVVRPEGRWLDRAPAADPPASGTAGVFIEPQVTDREQGDLGRRGRG